LLDVLPEAIAHEHLAFIKAALATGITQLYEYELPTSQFQEARIAVSGASEVLVLVRDITQRKQAESDIRNALEKEQELGELKSRFISMTSHEFRTPLSVILSSAEILNHFDLTEVETQLQFQQIYNAVQYMTQLLEDVLFISKVEAGKLMFEPTAITLTPFCRDLARQLQPTVNQGCAVHFSSSLSDSLIALFDGKMLRQILTNLLSNAIKYSLPDGQVTFDLELVAEETMVQFQVSDRGIGIPPEDQVHLFESFHRASNVGTLPGTGLGLTIVKRCVEAHQGAIAWKSQVGMGTTFTVTLPLKLGNV
jgi:signal transduction histidine kinase